MTELEMIFATEENGHPGLSCCRGFGHVATDLSLHYFEEAAFGAGTFAFPDFGWGEPVWQGHEEGEFVDYGSGWGDTD